MRTSHDKLVQRKHLLSISQVMISVLRTSDFEDGISDSSIILGTCWRLALRHASLAPMFRNLLSVCFASSCASLPGDTSNFGGCLVFGDNAVVLPRTMRQRDERSSKYFHSCACHHAPIYPPIAEDQRKF
mmetsp:Transcript_60560/g.126755  ORF Transcript_60560/g.126755 Transcript_60560/m.126755 type:complete len:130 (+) Transcript_60560:1317-1706(+)